MGKELYRDLKKLASASPLPCAILSVEKTKDGNCGEVNYFAINEPFKRSFYCLLQQTNNINSISYEQFDSFIEGKSYASFLAKEPKFEDIVFKTAWHGEPIRTYVDTTRAYGSWTEIILMPINCEHEDNVSYCQFMYTLNKSMDPDKFAMVSPEISSFVIKTCLELNEDRDFIKNLNDVAREIREYTNSFACSLISIDREMHTFKIVSESVLNDMFSIKEIFKDLPYEIIESWDELMEGTNSIIIKDESDMHHYEEKSPFWAATLRRDNVKSLCLVPLVRHKETIGYLYIANFDIAQTSQYKETLELISGFISTELASYQSTEAP